MNPKELEEQRVNRLCERQKDCGGLFAQDKVHLIQIEQNLCGRLENINLDLKNDAVISGEDNMVFGVSTYILAREASVNNWESMNKWEA